MKSSFKVFPTVSAQRTSTSTSAGTGAPEAREKSFSLFGVLQGFVKCYIAVITFWVALSLFLTGAASRSSCFPVVGHSGSLIIPQTSSILSSNLVLEDVVHIQLCYVTKFSNIPCNPPA